MLVDIKNIDDVHTVKKPWGYEKWIADGNPNFSYALKEIFFKAPYKTSIQFHKYKEETNYVQNGKGKFFYSKDPINVESFKKNEYSNESLQKIINELEQTDLIPGVVIHIKPGCVHRVEAIEDLTIIETSSTHLDDVFRINDEWGRINGKIDSEHR
jgi:quercetin dioxygenase-like cupin family protein